MNANVLHRWLKEHARSGCHQITLRDPAGAAPTSTPTPALLNLRTENVTGDSIMLFNGKGRPGKPPRPHTVPLDRDGVIADSFTPRQIAVKGWAGLTTPDAVRKAADVLADYDWLRRDVVQSGAAGGRPSDRYTINPAMLGGGVAA